MNLIDENPVTWLITFCRSHFPNVGENFFIAVGKQLGHTDHAIRAYLSFREIVLEIRQMISDSTLSESDKENYLAWWPFFDDGLKNFIGSSCSQLQQKFNHPTAQMSLKFCETLLEKIRAPNTGKTIAQVLEMLEIEKEEIIQSNIDAREKDVLLSAFRALLETLRGYHYLGITTIRAEAGKAIAELISAWDALKSVEAKKHFKSVIAKIFGLAGNAAFGILVNRLDALGISIFPALGFGS
jgi:hypothetical protein